MVGASSTACAPTPMQGHQSEAQGDERCGARLWDECRIERVLLLEGEAHQAEFVGAEHAVVDRASTSCPMYSRPAKYAPPIPTSPVKSAWAKLPALLMISTPSLWARVPAVYAATATGIEGGSYYGPSGLFGLRGQPEPARSSRASKIPSTARRLWELSEKLTKVRFSF